MVRCYQDKLTHDGYYYVKRLRLLEFLVSRGHKEYKTIPDPTNSKFNWFIFDYEEIAKDLDDYFTKLAMRNK